MSEHEKQPLPKVPGVTDPIKADIDTVLRTVNVPRIYANGFSVGHSLLEATILAQFGRTPVAAINLTFPALKGLYAAIGETIELIEKGLGEPIPEMNELAAKWKQNAE